jgi:hypothetical protein
VLRADPAGRRQRPDGSGFSARVISESLPGPAGISAQVVPEYAKNAIIAPEMESFGTRFGFTFFAHEVGDANRSGKVERPFHFEHNFLAGRTFTDWDDLNAQARAWCERSSWQICPARSCRQLFRNRLWKCSPITYLRLQKETFPELSPAL